MSRRKRTLGPFIFLLLLLPLGVMGGKCTIAPDAWVGALTYQLGNTLQDSTLLGSNLRDITLTDRERTMEAARLQRLKEIKEKMIGKLGTEGKKGIMVKQDSIPEPRRLDTTMDSLVQAEQGQRMLELEKQEEERMLEEMEKRKQEAKERIRQKYKKEEDTNNKKKVDTPGGDFIKEIVGLPEIFPWEHTMVLADTAAERQALIAFYNATNGDVWQAGFTATEKWKDSNGNFKGVVTSAWYGVEVNNSNGSVTKLELDGEGLSGSIPVELGNLSSLTWIDLARNELSGNIPTELGNLSSLIWINLASNELTGSIPSELGSLSNLGYIYLYANELSGSIPVELGNLSNLIDLRLYINELSGNIPTELGNLNKLRHLDLGGNNLTGSIPAELGNLSNLENLTVSSNNLTGSIPSSLGNLSNLDFLSFNNNSLSGSIPSSLGNLSNLRILYLINNSLSGSIPPELGNLGSLERLFLDQNELSGSIPSSLGNLGSLEWLYLDRNNLTGSIPIELGNLSNLHTLYLDRNNLTGNIPTEFGSLSNLSLVSLHTNELSGSIPSSLGNLGSLQRLYVYDNFLEDLPDFSSIPAQTFFDLNINNNYFTFKDILPNISRFNFANRYTPQRTIPSGGTQEGVTGGSYDFTFGIDPGITTNVYKWYKTVDGGTDTQVAGATTNTLSFTNLAVADTGRYYCQVTNPGVPNLTISSDIYQLTLAAGAGERQALIDLYNSTDGDTWQANLSATEKWKDANGNFKATVTDDWYGVTINNDGNVWRLDLENSGLSGIIPNSIGSLDSLDWLDLTNNSLVGGIPSTIGDMVKLRFLFLGINQLSGGIPPGLGNLNNLEYLDLHSNNLNGVIPPELGNLSDLKELDFSSNDLNGSIPADLGNLNNLQLLWLSSNNLSGIIPVELGNLNNLKRLFLNTNNLNGIIPAELGNLSSLQFLYLFSNNLSGIIPSELGNLSNLSNLRLYNNDLSGSIPSGLGNLSNLSNLRLENNNLSGIIPSELGNLSNLTTLWLYNNDLSGSIPSELGNLSNLTTLWLNNNNLSGSIPSELGNLSNLSYLRLYNNNLSGSIPLELGNLSNLSNLWLNTNNLNGSIPAELSNLSSLQLLYLNNNFLEDLPDFSDTTAFPDLNILDVDNNYFTFKDLLPNMSRFSSSTGYSPQRPIGPGGFQLGVVGESYSFTFDIDPGITSNVYQWYKTVDGGTDTQVAGATTNTLSFTNFALADTGRYYCQVTNPGVPDLTISSELYELTSVPQDEVTFLETLYDSLGGNGWNASFPDSAKWFINGGFNPDISSWFGVELDEGGHVVSLILDSLGLTGPIPPSIGDLDSLQVLDLSHNNISDTIPWAITDLINLEYLDLGDNDLTGPIPEGVGNLNNVVVFSVSNNQLSGLIPRNIGGMESLENLYLDRNELFGCLPRGLSYLENLRELWLNDNDLGCNLRSDLGELTFLERLRLDNNGLTGRIPTTFGNLDNIRELWLNNNNLTGGVPSTFAGLNGLDILDVSYNDLTYLPDLSGNPDLDIFVADNILTFDDLLPNTGILSGPLDQRPTCIDFIKGFRGKVGIGEGRRLRLSTGIDPNINNSVYNWTRNSTAVTLPPGNSNNNNYAEFPAGSIQSGSYLINYTNPGIPGLTLSTCPFDVGTIGEADLNWVEAKGYNGTTVEVSESRSYFDYSGRPLQSQSKVMSEGKERMASQPLYDSLGRAVVQTLAAPVGNGGFSYKKDFVTKDGAHVNADGLNGPLDKDTGNTLGHYYSTNNTREEHTPATDYPYTRTEFYGDGSGETKRSAGPGDVFHDDTQAGDRHIYGKTFPLTTELDGIYRSIRDTLYGTNSRVESFARNGIKSVSRDANGKETVTFSDSEGKVLVTALSYVDSVGAHEWEVPVSFDLLTERVGFIHIPYDPNGSSTDVNIITTSGGYTLTKLETGLEYTPPLVSQSGDLAVYRFGPGFYKIENLPGSFLSVDYVVKYYDPSFQFYDDLGRMTLMISPQGIKDHLDPNNGKPLDQVDRTEYTYNYLGELLSQTETDAGTANYIYRRDGQIRFSQNDKQKGEDAFSYTDYDEHNRPIESGEYVNGPMKFQSHKDIKENTPLPQYPDDLSLYSETGDGTVQATNSITAYSAPNVATGNTAVLLRAGQSVVLGSGFTLGSGLTLEAGIGTPAGGPTSETINDEDDIEQTGPTDPLEEEYKRDITRSTYDVAKQIELDMALNDEGIDPVGYQQHFTMGKVSYTEYQPESGGPVTSKTWYSFDELGRTEWMVQSIEGLGTRTIDYTYDFSGNVLEVAYQGHDAGESFFHRYTYDEDLRLDSVLTSRDSIDWKLEARYIYYLHGPLRRVEVAGTQGVDYAYTVQGWLKSINGIHQGNYVDSGTGFGKDVFNMQLDYFSGDYLSNSRPTVTGNVVSGGNGEVSYNGNIASMYWATQQAGKDMIEDAPSGFGYTYDEKYQLTGAGFGEVSGNTFIANSQGGGAFGLQISGYDLNGNIQGLTRNGPTGTSLHNLAYDYDGLEGSPNRLLKIPGHIKEYGYNAIGEMIKEVSDDGKEHEKNVRYDVFGKVREVRDENGKVTARFDYDDRGFRVAKYNGKTQKTTYYVRDAAGSTMAIYERAGTGGGLTMTELPIYGASRLGSYQRNVAGWNAAYELKDHLGNVRATFSDKGADEYYTNMDSASLTMMPLTNVDGFFNVVPDVEHYHSGVEEAGRRSVKLQAGANGTEGPYVFVQVQDGDEIAAEVYAYTEVASTDRVQANMQPTLRQDTTGNWQVNTPLFGTFVTPTDQGSSFTSQVYFNFLSLIGLFNSNNGGNIPTEEDPDSYAYKAFLKMELYLNQSDDVPVEIRKKAVTVPTGQLGQSWVKVALGWEGTVDIDQYCDPCGTTEPVIKASIVYDSVDVSGQDIPIWFDDMAVYKNAPGLEVLHHADYYPFGHIMREDYSRHFYTLRYDYQGDFSEKDEETGWNHFELREYDAVIGRWTAVDPERQYPSPYVGNGNNPIINIDPTGGSNPIYGSDGNLRGVDEFGLQGDAIVYDGAFENGMSQATILANGGKFVDISQIFRTELFSNPIAKNLFLESYLSLSERPDWDGIVTFSEAIDWFHYGNGQDLYVDISQMNFKSGTLSVETHFKGSNFSQANFFWGDTHPLSPDIPWVGGNFTMAFVYGTLRVNLLNRDTGLIGLQTDRDRFGGGFDGFDFNIPLYGWVAENMRSGGNPRPYNFMGYGNGHIHIKTPSVR